MERIDHNKGYSEDFWNVILDASKMVKCRYDMDAVEIGIYNAMEGD